jgi:hypothetical protein
MATWHIGDVSLKAGRSIEIKKHYQRQTVTASIGSA